MRQLVARSLLLAIFSAGPAMAADLPIGGGPQPVPTLVFSWTGWYVGGFGGGAMGRNASTSDPCERSFGQGCWLTTPGGEIVPYSMGNSYLAGVNAGYNYQIPGSAIVFGVETEFGALSLKGTTSFEGISAVSYAQNLVASSSIGPWYNATTARVGWAYDRAFLYGKAGFAISTIETTIEDTRGGLAPATGKKDVFGWAWGGGFEYALFDHWSLKAEYLWLGLNRSVAGCPTVSPGFAGPPLLPAPGSVLCATTTASAVQTFKIGFNYLLNAGPVYSRY